jgi:hypothetical protein
VPAILIHHPAKRFGGRKDLDIAISGYHSLALAKRFAAGSVRRDHST